MTKIARITIDLPLPEGTDISDPRIIEALDNLANVMEVQAEDGLYLGGHEDAELVDNETGESVENEHLLDWADEGHGLSVTFVSTAPPKHCANCADGACHHLDAR
jgi:hypothetical protein